MSDRLTVSAAWIDTPSATGWVGRIVGSYAGERVAHYVGGQPIADATGAFAAANKAELFAARAYPGAKVRVRYPRGFR